MLLEFKCSNHKSIGEEVKFSMLASADDSESERLIEYEDYLILPSVVIYGANGSGKSNLIGALELMQTIVIKGIALQPGDTIKQLPHKLSPEKLPSTYFIQFVRNDIRYAYGFSLVEGKVAEEYLYYFPNGKQVLVFNRNQLDVELGARFRKGFDSSLDVLKDNRLFLSSAANFSKSETIAEVFMFFKEDLVFGNITANNWAEFTSKLIMEKPDVKESILSLFDSMGTGIRDIQIRENSISAGMGGKGPIYSSIKPGLLDIQFVYDRFRVPYDEESVGTRKLFQMSGLIYDAILKGKVLVCDEIETSLHESLMGLFLQLFYKARGHERAQLIFTTHDTGLLSKNLFRRDQIWFTQLRDCDRSTDLYSLSDIHNVRKSENFERGYVSGRYGAVPMLNNRFAEEFCSDNNEEK